MKILSKQNAEQKSRKLLRINGLGFFAYFQQMEWAKFVEIWREKNYRSDFGKKRREKTGNDSVKFENLEEMSKWTWLFFFAFLSWLGGKKLWKIYAPKKNVEKMLKEYWQNVEKILKKSGILSFDSNLNEWM